MFCGSATNPEHFPLLTGIRLQAHPTGLQKKTLSQWMGCARVIWNAKCDEHKYMASVARLYKEGVWAPIDKTFSQFKDSELTPWLSQCPSQILRNSAYDWFRAYQGFFRKLGGRPRRKKKTDRGSIFLTNEVFRFEKCADGNLRLFIGTKTNNIGYLAFKAHRNFKIPNSIRLIKEAGKWFVSFSYEVAEKVSTRVIPHFTDPAKLLEWLRNQGQDWLEANIASHDRGMTVPVHSGDCSYDFTPEQKRIKKRNRQKIKRLQRQLSRRNKGSNRRKVTKHKLARAFLKDRNIRKDFSHKTSRAIVDAPALINVFEFLKVQNMVRKPKPKIGEDGKYLPNGAAAKTGLAKGLLEPGLGMIVDFARYKSAWEGKIILLVDPRYTSQECASCGHVDADNRKTQAQFRCISCDHADNADRNASIVIGKRAVSLILDTGTVLSERGVLSKRKPTDTGRGADGKTDGESFSPDAHGDEASKEKRQAGFLEAA